MRIVRLIRSILLPVTALALTACASHPPDADTVVVFNTGGALKYLDVLA